MLTHLTISVSHHDGCRLVHLANWSFKNVIRHHDRCRLVQPAKWDILTMTYTIMTDVDWCIPPCGTLHKFRFAFMTDANWCIPPCWSFGISIQFKMSRIDQFVYNSINHSHAINHQTFQISHFQIHMHFRNIISKIYLFHIIISDLFGKLPKHLK